MAKLTTMEEERAEESNASVVKKAARAGKRKMPLKYKIIIILLALVLMGILRTGFLFVIIAMLPSIVAYYMDVSNERYAFKTIMACNLTGLFPSLGTMLLAGHSSAVLQATMGNVSNWMVIYGASMVGWLLIEICPMVAQIMIVGFHGTQVGRIERTQKKIVNEWGPEVVHLTKSVRNAEEEEEE